jgi:hypothetical protein
MKKYEYLKRYVNFNDFDGKKPMNWFESVSENDIFLSETRLGFKFPDQLREFWLNIGYGSLPNGSSNYNHFLYPKAIADILLSDPDSPDCPVIYEFYDMLEPGDMPFFEIGDSVSFLYMRPKSEKPNAVYDSLGNEVSPSFEEFIHRLYYESPTFYLESDSWGKLPQNKPASNG